MLCHLWCSMRPSAPSLTWSAAPTEKPTGREKTSPQEVLNPLLHFLSPQAPLQSPGHVSPPSSLGRDLVTFECPIKRRGSVRAPLWVPFRHVTDERSAIYPCEPHTHLHKYTLLPPSPSFSCSLPPSVLPLFHTNTLFPG